MLIFKYAINMRNKEKEKWFCLHISNEILFYMKTNGTVYRSTYFFCQCVPSLM